MIFQKFEPLTIEPQIQKFWSDNSIYEKVKQKNKNRPKFYFLDGPPYTSGKVHLGTAWNKSLKDCVLRYKRMRGLDVWDRAGYDMHGLPTEQGVEKELKLKKDRIPQFGVDKFVKACEDFSVSNLKTMNTDFIRMGVWMDFENAYQSITPEFIEGVWWLIHKAHENGRLYKGFRTVYWDFEHQTALAKHELEYKTVKDRSIFVKFKIKGTPNEYLIIWTTTPWTIAFNLAVMVNPTLDYVKAKVDDEIWIVAKALAGPFISALAQKSYTVIQEFKGENLGGIEYEHPWQDMLSLHYTALKKECPKVHTVVFSEEYVHTDSGTGLVHVAPGCGPEDYEVGHRNGITPFNTLTEDGHYPQGMGKLTGLHAIKNNPDCIEMLKDCGAVVGESIIEHEYPHGQRSKKPIIFRATEQWFFKVEDMIEKLVSENKKIKWVPEAAFNAFESWLQNLRDNSITKQRYWGTPVPIWICDKTGNYEVIGSRAELKKKAGKIPENLHKPWIDEVTYKSPFHPQGTMRRIPDILDVWVDAGSAAWNCLDYPQATANFEKLFPADFILEGKDQIRGWFNLLHINSMLGFGKTSFAKVYMHGFINDAQGRKMSKSLGNYIVPQEVINEYGADTLRYYMIGGANPGLDLNYNFNDIKVKHKNLSILWNVHNFMLQLHTELGSTKHQKVRGDNGHELDIPHRYILSRLHSTIKKATELFEEYKLNEIPLVIEALYLDLSRTYIQLIREKAAGTHEQKKVVHDVVYEVLFETIKLLSPIAPFITEAMYQNMRGQYKLSPESIHAYDWPTPDGTLIDTPLENTIAIVGDVMQSALALREKIGHGVRWPLKELIVVTKQEDIQKAVNGMKEIIKAQLNVKEVLVKEFMHDVRHTVKLNYETARSDFTDMIPKIIAHLTINSPETIVKHLQKDGVYECKIQGVAVPLKPQHFIIGTEVPKPFFENAFLGGHVYLNSELDETLEAEGFAREVTRRIQNLRKKAGLQKPDVVTLFIKTDEVHAEMLKNWSDGIKQKVGAQQMLVSINNPGRPHAHHVTEKIKGITFDIFMQQV